MKLNKQDNFVVKPEPFAQGAFLCKFSRYPESGSALIVVI